MNPYLTFKKIITLFIFLFFMILLHSCEEVIEIELDDAEPMLVIEGSVTDGPGPYTVTITKTTDYYNPGTYPTVDSALVIISNNLSSPDTLQETSNGVYQTVNLQGIPGRVYTLIVVAEGQTYNAISTMQQSTEIDSIYYRENEGGIRPKDQKGYDLVVKFRDRPGVDDFKRLKIYQNGKLKDGYFLYNGRLSDGNEIEYDRIHADFELNDFVFAELHSIDEATYEYYSTLGNAIASSGGNKIQTKVPANPNSNISGGALGYFGAFSVRSDSVLIK